MKFITLKNKVTYCTTRVKVPDSIKTEKDARKWIAMQIVDFHYEGKKGLLSKATLRRLDRMGFWLRDDIYEYMGIGGNAK